MSLLERFGGGHLTDRDVAHLWAAGGGDPHLDGCAACRAKFETFDRWVLGVGEEMRTEADAAFPQDRLAAQQAHIARRLEAMAQPARVLAFPKAARAVISGHSHVRRWITVAAAAGLIAGVGVGQMLDTYRSIDRSARVSAPGVHLRAGVSTARAKAAVTPASLAADEDFLSDADAFSRPRVSSALLPLDDMTPHARDLMDRSR